jgi:2-polyprenyl-3-methyl-5-hydroxy-6-metoxy-1,4-benzoquinol methylase
MNYYNEKGKSYFSSYREDLLTAIERIGKFESAFEIGCGNGALLSELKTRKIVKSIVGIDPNGKLPEENNFDRFYYEPIANVLPKLERSEKFDLIIFADVLEHLEDPWSILNTICTEILDEKGIVVISIPNFRNIFTLGEIILSNSFNYKSEGVLDNTHLRFFCKKDIINMIRNAGLEIILITQKFKYEKSVFFKKNRLKYINILTLNIFPYWLADQIIAIGKKQ